MIKGGYSNVLWAQWAGWQGVSELKICWTSWLSSQRASGHLFSVTSHGELTLIYISTRCSWVVLCAVALRGSILLVCSPPAVTLFVFIPAVTVLGSVISLCASLVVMVAAIKLACALLFLPRFCFHVHCIISTVTLLILQIAHDYLWRLSKLVVSNYLSFSLRKWGRKK